MFDSALSGDIEQQGSALQFVHERYPLPGPLRMQYKVAVNRDASTVAVQFEFPDYASAEIVTGYSGKYRDKEKLASSAQKRKLVKQCLYSCIIRSAYITSTLAPRFGVQSIVVNVEQNWFDAATGQAKHGVIASLQAPVDYLIALDLAKLDPEACFKHLKGIATPCWRTRHPFGQYSSWTR